jgi:ABC-type Fe3+-hydroxamate transport system substrate-binding protein
MKNQIKLKKEKKSTDICNTAIHVLLIKDFSSSTTTITELKQIFRQSNIKVVFTNEIFETDMEVKGQHVNKEDISEEYVKSLLSKIKQLEEQVSQLKCATST